MSLSRRTLLASTAGAGAVASFPAFAQAKLDVVHIMVLNPLYLTDYPQLIAEKVGIFAKHGIHAEFVTSVNPIVPLLTGDVDIVTLGIAVGINVVIKGQDFEFIGVASPATTLALMVRPDSPLAKVAHKWPESFTQLKGKTLGVTVAGAQVDLMAHWMSTMVGLTPDKDITIQAAGDAGTLAANLERGQGTYDAAIVPSPLYETLEQRKVAVSILDFYKGEGPPQLAGYPYATLATRKSFVQKNPDLISRYLTAMRETVDFIQKPDNRKQVTGIIGDALKVSPESLEGNVNTFLKSIGDIRFSRQQWDSAIDMMKANGMVKQEYKYEDYVYAGARVG